MDTTMEINGLYASFNMPVALQESAFAQGLPPHAVQPVYKVDEYNCPDNWMHGSGKASSYFVAIKPSKGMWLDFVRNEYHTHHVAVLVSTQGINPITGQRQMGFKLEQYRENCPLHNVPFGGDRFCSVCGYKWPGQNYLATTAGGRLWIDGFMNDKGEVRQYVFTEETARGVAAQIIGEDRVFAIGVAFYLSKQPKPVPAYNPRSSYAMGSLGVSKGGGLESFGPVRSRGAVGQSVSPKAIEIAAGAKIRQDIGVDPENVERFWEEEAAGFLYINYCDVETCNLILSQGMRDLSKGGEGFLAGKKTYHG
jgi:hypothetical protein